MAHGLVGDVCRDRIRRSNRTERERLNLSHYGAYHRKGMESRNLLHMNQRHMMQGFRAACLVAEYPNPSQRAGGV